jgi:hypothetical protein
MKRQKKYKAQGFYIEKNFECLCVITLGDNGRASPYTGIIIIIIIIIIFFFCGNFKKKKYNF